MNREERQMRDLDAPESFAELDPKGMLNCIAELPQQCEDGWNQVQAARMPHEYGDVDQVLILGMGGSAIGGDLLRALLLPECPVPIIVHRDYDLPAFVDQRTLVIACSYSGNTEETLAGFEGAVRSGARVVSITTGGELERRSGEQGLPLYSYHYESQPRAALGYSLMFPLGILQRLGMTRDKSADVAEAVAVMRGWQAEIQETVPAAENRCKSLASKLYRRLPVIYGAEHLSEVARRWKGQFNENSKSWGVSDVLPELNHNTVVGYPSPPDLSRMAHVIMLTSTLNHPRVRLRFDITRELLQKHGFGCDTVEARGRSALAQVLSTVHFGDYVSYYLAMLHEVDPWSIGNIEFVKARLKTSEIS
jgi:glucose/mannose-6-phosphate isomerase